METIISISAIFLSLSALLLNMFNSYIKDEPIFPDKDKIRRTIKLLLFNEYEPPKTKIDNVNA